MERRLGAEHECPQCGVRFDQGSHVYSVLIFYDGELSEREEDHLDTFCSWDHAVAYATAESRRCSPRYQFEEHVSHVPHAQENS